MKKTLTIFIIFVALFIIAKVLYSKYCETKAYGCKENKYEDTILSDDHMDNS